MAKNDDYHVLPDKESGGWKVKRSNAKRASKQLKTKAEAEKYGKKLAKKNKTELSIHNRNGKIKRKHSYKKDNYPPEG